MNRNEFLLLVKDTIAAGVSLEAIADKFTISLCSVRNWSTGKSAPAKAMEKIVVDGLNELRSKINAN